jgi:hypothetical protein
MRAPRILDAFQNASRRFRTSLRALLGEGPQRDASCRSATVSSAHSTRSTPRRRSQESGYAFLFALGLILLMIASSLVVLQKGATIRRRRIEQETIWRGNQYARAIRLYYHKTGHYPQTLDDLEKGMAQVHFLRQAYKNPTNSADGSWRFIYVNSAGQIIGSTKYANLQQMALMDANGGQLPTTLPGQPGQPGQPGVPVSTLADSNAGSQATTPAQIAALGNPNGVSSTQNPGSNGPDVSPNPPPDGQNPQPSAGQSPQNPFGPTNPQNSPGPQNPPNPPTTALGTNGLGNGQSMPGLVPGGLAPGGLAVDPATLAAMALLKPTGPVDGPVLGAFLTGVACTQDTSSLKFYHGGKKYINWEFIWNPLEDAAAAMQQQLGGAAAGAAGGSLGLPIANPFGGGPVANPGTNFGANPGGNSPGQQNPPTQPNNQFPQPQPPQ